MTAEQENKGFVEILPSKSEAGSGYYWHHKGDNGEVDATSGSETYENPTDASVTIKRLFGEDVEIKIVYRSDKDGD